MHSSVFSGKSARYSLDKKKKGDHSFLEKMLLKPHYVQCLDMLFLDQTASYHNFNSSKGTDLSWLFFEQNFYCFLFVCFFVTKSTSYFCWQVLLRFVFVSFIWFFCAPNPITSLRVSTDFNSFHDWVVVYLTFKNWRYHNLAVQKVLAKYLLTERKGL